MREVYLFIKGRNPDSNHYDGCIKTNNIDTKALMMWLGFGPVTKGVVPVSEIRARCMRRLWPERINDDNGSTVLDPNAPPGVRRPIHYRPPNTLKNMATAVIAMIDKHASPEDYLEIQ